MIGAALEYTTYIQWLATRILAQAHFFELSILRGRFVVVLIVALKRLNQEIGC